MDNTIPYKEARDKPEPVLTGTGPKGLNQKWIIWYRANFRVTTNIAIRIGLRTLREQVSLQ